MGVRLHLLSPSDGQRVESAVVLGYVDDETDEVSHVEVRLDDDLVAIQIPQRVAAGGTQRAFRATVAIAPDGRSLRRLEVTACDRERPLASVVQLLWVRATRAPIPDCGAVRLITFGTTPAPASATCYPFHGRKDADAALHAVVASRALRDPFCLCYAGAARAAHEVMDRLAAIVRHPHYVRVDGRPLVLVRAESLPADVARCVAGWRSVAARRRMPQPFLLRVQPCGAGDAAAMGFDGAVELPPSGMPLDDVALGALAVPRFSYEQARDFAATAAPPATMFRGVLLWHEPPRGAAGVRFVDASPAAYRAWLEQAIAWTRVHHPGSRRLVFVVPWNGCSEATLAAPDHHYDQAYADATRDATREATRSRDVPSVRRLDPLVSVVLPIYNHEAYVGRAVRSVLDQTIDDVELILIDDGSTDDSLAVARESAAHAGDRRVRVIAQANRGSHAALNTAIAAARGTYCAILNSDDAYAPDRLELMIGAMRAERADLSYSRVAYVDAGGRDVSYTHERALTYLWKQEEQRSFPHAAYALLDFNAAISTGNLVFRRSLFDAAGGFAPLVWCHDWDFLLTALRRGRTLYVDQSLYYYRLHEGSASATYDIRLAYAEGVHMLRRFFADPDYCRRLHRLDPAYYERFVRARGLDRFGALSILGGRILNAAAVPEPAVSAARLRTSSSAR